MNGQRDSWAERQIGTRIGEMAARQRKIIAPSQWNGFQLRCDFGCSTGSPETLFPSSLHLANLFAALGAWNSLSMD